PPCPVFARGMAVFRDFFGATGRGNMGTQLLHLMLEAGFRAPDCRAEYPVDGGPDSPFYEWLAESLRSIPPRPAAARVVQEAPPRALGRPDSSKSRSSTSMYSRSNYGRKPFRATPASRALPWWAALRGGPEGPTAHRRSAMRRLAALGQIENPGIRQIVMSIT